MITFNTSKEVMDFLNDKRIVELEINRTFSDSWWTRDDGAIIMCSEFATIAVFPPLTVDYKLIAENNYIGA